MVVCPFVVSQINVIIIRRTNRHPFHSSATHYGHTMVRFEVFSFPSNRQHSLLWPYPNDERADVIRRCRHVAHHAVRGDVVQASVDLSAHTRWRHWRRLDKHPLVDEVPQSAAALEDGDLRAATRHTDMTHSPVTTGSQRYVSISI